MPKRITCLIALICLLLSATPVGSAENGAENIVLNGGTRGKVSFPHLTHQTVLQDCNKCHAVFPQETGAIDKLKQSGDLKRKQVMNKSCVKCHKTMKKDGHKTGPTTCAKCHVRG